MNDDLLQKLKATVVPDVSFTPSIVSHLPKMPELRPDYKKLNPAQWMYERLAEMINDFEKELDSSQEVGARLVTFGQSITFHIKDMGYHGPDIITFYGQDCEGKNMQLIQHYSQLSILLMAVKSKSDTPERIGFNLIGRSTKDKNSTGNIE